MELELKFQTSTLAPDIYIFGSNSALEGFFQGCAIVIFSGWGKWWSFIFPTRNEDKKHFCTKTL